MRMLPALRGSAMAREGGLFPFWCCLNSDSGATHIEVRPACEPFRERRGRGGRWILALRASPRRRAPPEPLRRAEGTLQREEVPPRYVGPANVMAIAPPPPRMPPPEKEAPPALSGTIVRKEDVEEPDRQSVPFSRLPCVASRQSEARPHRSTRLAPSTRAARAVFAPLLTVGKVGAKRERKIACNL